MLRKERVQLDLVHGGHDGPLLLELLEVGDRPVGEADGLDLAGLIDLLHLAPRLGLVPRAVDGASAVGVHREERVRVVLGVLLVFGFVKSEFGGGAYGDQADGPVDELNAMLLAKISPHFFTAVSYIEVKILHV